MAKRQLTAAQAFDLRQALHVAVLDALMTSRRWEPGEIAFQGGTSLHLVHGSPRFSEDLDFLVLDDVKLGAIEEGVKRRLEGTWWIPPDMQVSVNAAKADRNPYVFDVTLSGAGVIGSVRVKVELWRAPKVALAPLTVVLETVRVASGAAAGAQAFVPSLDQHEIFVDKVFAVAARRYLKPRDVFDLYWLEKQGSDANRLSADDLTVRLATYPNARTKAWIENAQARRADLLSSIDKVHADLRRWLPSSWPLTQQMAADMVAASVRALDLGIERMRELAGRADFVESEDGEPELDVPR